MVEGSERDEYIKQLEEVSKKHFIRFFKNTEDFEKFFESLRDDERWLKSLVFMNALDSLEKEFSELKFLLYFSLIEFIMSEEPYVPFQDWLTKRVSEKLVILDEYITLSNLLKKKMVRKTVPYTDVSFKKLTDEYYTHYGSTQKIKKFFIEYVSTVSQTKMMDSFRLIKESDFKQQTEAGIRTDYCKACTDEFRLSTPASTCPGYSCDTKNNSRGLEEDVKNLVNKIIKIRSAVVHNADWIIYPPKVFKKEGVETSLTYGAAYSQISIKGKNYLVIISESPGEYFKIIDEGIFKIFTET
jgi:hypothetical protein